jgi:hypothetical protein
LGPLVELENSFDLDAEWPCDWTATSMGRVCTVGTVTPFHFGNTIQMDEPRKYAILFAEHRIHDFEAPVESR